MSQLDTERNYVLYIINGKSTMTEEEKKTVAALWETKTLGGMPGTATEQKGEVALAAMVAATARALRVIKEDETAPRLQKEFL